MTVQIKQTTHQGRLTYRVVARAVTPWQTPVEDVIVFTKHPSGGYCYRDFVVFRGRDGWYVWHDEQTVSFRSLIDIVHRRPYEDIETAIRAAVEEMGGGK